MFDQVVIDLRDNALSQWDYSSIFPSGYAGPKGVVIETGWIWQLDSQIEPLTNQGQLTKPIVTIDTAPSRDEPTRTFSDLAGVGQLPGTTYRLGRRARVHFIVGGWVDQQLGGMTLARALAGQIVGAMFYYRNRLTTIRHIDLVHNHEVYEASPQLYRFDIAYEGDVFYTIDV